MWIVLEDRFRRPFHIDTRTIEFMEPLADTRLHLVSKETLVTRLSPSQVLDRIVAAGRVLIHHPPELRPHREDVEAWEADAGR